ncbi:MAG: menaquinone biosynthesis protein [Archaeoglobaceae archaeon]|nr:menaquinone biosynthesis protein [Archaeoglobaceae archaeon]
MKIGKFGFVNNFLPYFKLEKEKKYEIVEGTPRKLSEMFEKGEIVYAPIPSFEILKKGYDPGKFCVASDGEVYSVIVASKRKRLDDSPIAIMDNSITSANMMKIIKAEKGLINKLVPVNGKFDEIVRNFDHVLVIGDEAIKARMVYRVLMDIGEEWKELTGLPAVFGISVSRVDGIDEDVLSSLEWGRKHIDEVVRFASEKFKLPEEFLLRYFETLIHTFGSKERKSLEVFGELCYECGIL